MFMSGGTQSRVKVTLRNPLDKADTVDYTILVEDTVIGQMWFNALQEILNGKKYLEKNFCFLGFPDNVRNVEFICDELNRACEQINKFFGNEYVIDEVYTSAFVQKEDLSPNQTAMNLLHNRFEHLQGTVENLSDYYKRADYETKFAIRQLNILCHEAESLMLSQRKKVQAPEWIRPSQITTFLNAERFEFPTMHKRTFNKSRYDRKFGGVYLHWTQIGKTLYEVFCDENGADVDQAVCDAITHLRYYSGEFDIEWGRSVEYYGKQPWHTERLDEFSMWLLRNGFDHNDAQYNYGYHQIGQVENLGTPEETWAMLSTHLDIYKIEAGTSVNTFDYSWSDRYNAQQQITRLKRGYDHSSRG